MSMKPPEWNTALGRSLYNDGLSYRDIAERCGVSASAVAHQAKRNWRGAYRPTSVAGWNTALGRTLWDKGLLPKAIAAQCGTTRMAVIGYASRHWPSRPGDAERYARCFVAKGEKKAPQEGRVVRAKPLPPGATTLPPLMSLTFGD
jgi:hypothetical protein